MMSYVYMKDEISVRRSCDVYVNLFFFTIAYLFNVFQIRREECQKSKQVAL